MIAFVVAITLVTTGFWQVVQSERFARFVSVKLKKALKDRYSIEANFAFLEVNFLPPAVTLHDVNFITNVNDAKTITRMRKVGINFGFINILDRDFKIKEISFTNGEVAYEQEIKQKKSDKSLKDKNYIQTIFSKYKQDIFKKVPIQIKNIKLNNVVLKSVNEHIEITSLNLKGGKRSFSIEGEIDSLKLQMLKNVKYLPQDGYDRINFSLKLSHDVFRINYIEIKNKLDVASLKGKTTYRDNKPFFEGSVEYKGSIERALENANAKFKDADKIHGYINAKVAIKGDLEDFSLNGKFGVRGLESPWASADSVSLEAAANNGKVEITKLVVSKGKGEGKLLKPVTVFDLNNKTLMAGTADFSATSLFTNDVLKAIDSFEIFKGFITGFVKINWNRDYILFTIKEGTKLDDFKLISKKDGERLLGNKSITLLESEIQYFFDTYVRLDIESKIPHSHLKLNGVVDLDDRKLSLEVANSTIDLFELGPIVDEQLYGRGNVNMIIAGPFDNVKFHFNVNLENAKVLDFSLGKVIGSLTLDLESKVLNISNVKAFQKISKINGDGKIDFSGKKLNLAINIGQGNFEEAFIIANPVIGKFKRDLKGIVGFYEGDINIRGGFAKKDLIVNGDISARDITFYDREDVNSINASILYKNNVLNINNIQARKAGGRLDGKVTVKLEEDTFSYTSNLRNLRLKDFYSYQVLNLGFDGNMGGSSSGSGSLNNYTLKSRISITDGKIGGVKLEDSHITVHKNRGNIFTSGNIWNNVISFESYLNFDKKENQRSYFKGKISSTDVKKLAGLVSAYNILDNSIYGRLDLEVDASFDINNLTNTSLEINLNKFNFYRDKLRLNKHVNRDKIIVKEGKIKKWDIAISGGEDFIGTKGEGNFADKFNIYQNFSMDASLLELLSEGVQKSNGRIFGEQTFRGNKQNVTKSLEITSKNSSLKLKKVPGEFSNIGFNVSVIKDKFVLKKLVANYGRGTILGSGTMTLKVPFPEIAFNFKLREAKIPFLKKSHIISTADVKVRGDRFPYSLDGNVSLLHGQIDDSFKDLVQNLSYNKIHSRHIPKNRSYHGSNYLSYNLNLDIFNPITVNNNLADLKILGNCVIKGNFIRPLINGSFSVVPGESKFTFKDHNFILDEGTISFNDNIRDGGAIVKFLGVSNINEYVVKLDIFGQLSHVNIELSSEPPLPKEDILSLLTLGVTSDINRNLEDKDRQSAATLGLGSLVVDQLRLHKGLSNSLGLRLSIQPEFHQEESSLLVGRTGEAEGGSSKKLKTTTKIKVQKKVSDSVDLSLSSTVGDSADQKQEMNIIYNVNSNLSLEGVYEIKASDVDSGETPDSGGFDIKYRVSF